MRPSPFLTFLFALSVLTFTACSRPFASEAPRLTTSSGWVSVPALNPAEWTCLPIEVEQGGVRAEMVRCSLASEGAVMHLIAKDYQVPLGAELSARVLATEVYARQYARIYKDIRVGSSHAVRWAGAQAWDTSFTGTHPALGPVSKVERVAVRGSHVIVLSAEGRTNDAIAHQETIVSWFERARLAHL